MTQIYVVVSQGTYFNGQKGVPVAAYSDYPTAFAYAKTIFKGLLGSQETAKDLVFLLTLNPTPGTTTTTTVTTPAVAK
jgi:hypothetical protein